MAIYEDDVSRRHNEVLKFTIKALEQKSILDEIRDEIAKYGAIFVKYEIKGRRNKDIEQIVEDVLLQAKAQVLDIIDKYKEESESEK